MEVTEERKLADKLGSNWKIAQSTYEDGPPHRTIIWKSMGHLSVEVATIVNVPSAYNGVGPCHIRVRDKAIAEEIEAALNSTNLQYKVFLVN